MRAPAQSFSTREHSRASATRSRGRSTASAPSVAELEQREAERDGQRRRGGEAGAARHAAGDLQARGQQREPGSAELGDRAVDVGAPALRRDRVLEREAVALVEVGGECLDERLAAVPLERGGAHLHALGDREGQREPAVVIGVLADHVDAAGRESARSAYPTRSIAPRSSAAASSGSTSPMKVPAPCSEPARYFSFSAVRSGG